MEEEIMLVFKQGYRFGETAYELACSDPAFDEPPGFRPPTGWAAEAAHAAGYTASEYDSARAAAPTGAWIVGYLLGWRDAHEAAQ